MKKVINEWRNFIKESETEQQQIRIELGKKMNQHLFASLDPSQRPDTYGDYGPDILKKYKYLHWAIHGTKMERASGQRHYRPEMGLKFVEQKVRYFLSFLSEEEKRVLQADIPQIVSLIRKGDAPTFAVQIPVEMTGHADIDPAFRVPYFGRKSIDDWGLGGSIYDRSGDNYIFYVFDVISMKLPSSRGISILSDQSIRQLYFMSETEAEAEIRDEPAETTNTDIKNLATLDYDAWLANIKRNR